MFPKNKRVKDRKLLDSYQGSPCNICGKTEGTVAHHLKTKGAGGDDLPENLIAVCHEHHREIHDMGNVSFFEKYNSQIKH